MRFSRATPCAFMDASVSPPQHVNRGGQRVENAMAEALFLPGGVLGRQSVNLKQLVDDYERRLILEALERMGGNQRRAAAELGVLPTTLNEKMRRLGLRACDQRGSAPPATTPRPGAPTSGWPTRGPA